MLNFFYLQICVFVVSFFYSNKRNVLRKKNKHVVFSLCQKEQHVHNNKDIDCHCEEGF